MVYLTDGAQTYASYSCDNQYDLYGAQRRTCLANGTWDLEEPSCSKIKVTGEGPDQPRYPCSLIRASLFVDVLYSVELFGSKKKKEPDQTIQIHTLVCVFVHYYTWTLSYVSTRMYVIV